MSKAYLDTTILTDALLKPGELGKAAKAAIRRYDTTELPVYAIKEFKAGPLKNFAWMHNTLVSTGSFKGSLRALQRMSRTPKTYLTSTALEALTEASDSIGSMTGPELIQKYGKVATLDSVQCDEYRYAIRMSISKAWKRRRKVTTRTIQELTCYREAEPFEERGLIILEPYRCKEQEGCCLAPALKQDLDSVRKLRDAVDAQPKNEERRKRYQALREIARKPKTEVTEKMCRHLGDAMFAFFAPQDATILTTNIKDHEPLANSLGKQVERP